MKTAVIMSLSCVLLVAFGCSEATAPAKSTKSTPSANSGESISVKYYYGKVVTSSPDGKIPYGPAKFSLAKRTVNRTTGQISEVVLNDGMVFNTMLVPVGKGLSYNTSDTQGTFSGSITFKDKTFTAWQYEINMKNGTGSIKGRGWIDAEGLKTEKRFYDPKGVVRVLITEDLKEINEVRYKELSAASKAKTAPKPAPTETPES